MKTNFFPQVLTAFVMIFVVASCAVDPNIETARLALTIGDYEEVMEAAEAAIESNPESGHGYYYMGIAHLGRGGDKDPDQRAEDYEKGREYLMEAKSRYEQEGVSGDEYDNIPEVIIDIWGYEHNSGIEPLTDDIVSSSEDSLKLSRHHFSNAIAINPDSSQTYNLLAEVNFALGDLEEAERITRHIIYELEDADLFNYYRLALYLMEDDRDAEAIDVLYEARELYPDEIEIVQEIANAYLRLGKSDEAMEAVQELMERDPENPQYRLVYATQIYQIVQDIDENIRDLYNEVYDINSDLRQEARKPDYDEDKINEMSATIEQKLEEAEDLIEESFRFSEEAENELLLALESDPENADIHATLGIVYQNRAAVYQDKRNMTDDMDEADEFDALAKEYLEKSLPHYEKAAELEPDDPEHWVALFRVYTNLGMDEKAAEAREKAGI